MVKNSWRYLSSFWCNTSVTWPFDSPFAVTIGYLKCRDGVSWALGYGLFVLVSSFIGPIFSGYVWPHSAFFNIVSCRMFGALIEAYTCVVMNVVGELEPKGAAAASRGFLAAARLSCYIVFAVYLFLQAILSFVEVASEYVISSE